MGALEIIGATTVGLVGLAACILVLEIGANVLGGIFGAYRLSRIRKRNGLQGLSHRQAFRIGLTRWAGERYRDGIGTFWQINGLIVPVDARDPISKDRFYGA